jgi:DNA repair exonuclease SbcCD ATPase subunit
MKFNLKNRRKKLKASKPWSKPLDTIKNLQQQIDEDERWFDGFEKELRERLNYLEDYEFPPKCCISLLKEILGE